MEPYLFENNERLDDPKVRETIEAYTQFRHSPEASLMEGRIESTLSETELASDIDATMEMLRGPDWQVIAANAKQNWAIAYICLLLAAAIHLTSGQRSATSRLGRFLEDLDGMMSFPKIEIQFIHRFFERGNQERFFRQIQANGRDFTGKLRNMAWDISGSRTILQNVSAIARLRSGHADFVAPYFVTFDQPLRELLSGYQANGLITFKDKGVKSILIYPMAIETALAEAFQSSQHLLTPERQGARLQRMREFLENESRREECIQHAEGRLNAAFSATAAP
jgi:hypothetical protein